MVPLSKGYLSTIVLLGCSLLFGCMNKYDNATIQDGSLTALTPIPGIIPVQTDTLIVSDTVFSDRDELLDQNLMDPSLFSEVIFEEMTLNLQSPSDCTFWILDTLDVFLSDGTQDIHIAHLDSIPSNPGKALELTPMNDSRVRDIFFRDSMQMKYQIRLKDTLLVDLQTSLEAVYIMVDR